MHYRQADGKPFAPGATQRVHLFGHGLTSAVRLAWSFAHDRKPASDKVVYRCCASFDCLAPAHLKLGTRKDAARTAVKLGKYDTPARRKAVAVMTEARRRVSPAHRAAVADATKTVRQLADETGLSVSRIYTLRREVMSGRRVASVFHMGAA